MKELQKLIQEKLILNKTIKKSKNIIIPAGNYSDKLDLPNNRVDFPITIEIDHKYSDIYYYYGIVKSNKTYWYYKFYDEDQKNTLTLSEKEIILVFEEEKGIMTNTKYGWKPIIWRK